MNSSQQQQVVRSSRRRRTSGLALGVVAVTLAFAASLAAIALAGSSVVTVTAASNSKLGHGVVVDSQGRTLYVLSPETTHHLLCKSSGCLKFWPPVTAHSSKTKLTAGSGVHGRLGILRRSNGTMQVTLGGLPLYRYSGDDAKGQANGQDIHSFGGTWHVLAAASADGPSMPTTPSTPATPTTPSTPTTPTAPSPAPGYEY
jgi:predicted lipoprotein with Yx(FWY)xxD motif